MKSVKLFTPALAVAVLAGCSDGHDERTDGAADSLAAGIYTAVAGSTFVPDSSAPVEEGNVNVIVTGTGEAIFMMHDGPLRDDVVADELPFQLAGTLDAGKRELGGSLTVYPDGQADAGSLVLEGALSPGENISATYTWGGTSGSLDLKYTSLYDEPSSLEKLEGVWSIDWGLSLGDGNSYEFLTMTVTVFADGTLSGSDTSGCVFDGTMSIIDPAHGAYRVELGLSSCGERDGSYRGLAYVTPSSRDGVDGRTLRFGVSNRERSFNARLFGPPG